MFDPGKDYDKTGEGFYKGRDSLGKKNNLLDVPDGDSSSNIQNSDDQADKLKAQDKQLKDMSADEANKLGFNYRTEAERKQGFRSRYKLQKGSIKKYAAATGIFGSIVGMVLAAFLALIPLKFEFIANLITDQVSTVTEYAVEKRVDYLLSRYVNRSVLGKGAGKDVYVGNTLAGSLYRNWQGANFEKKLLDDFGLEFERIDGQSDGGGVTRWQVFKDGKALSFDEAINGPNGPEGSGDFELKRGQMRQVIRKATRDGTQWHQFLKRRTMRRIMQNKYNVPTWFVDFFGERAGEAADDANTRYQAKKTQMYKWTADNVIGRVSTRYGLYFNCLINVSNCKNLDADKGSQPDKNNASEIDELLDQTDADGNPIDFSGKEANEALNSSVRKFSVKKVLGSFVAGAGIVDFLSQIVETINDGVVSEVYYKMNIDAAIGASAWVNIARSQINEGSSVLSEDAQLLFERFDGFEESPVYGALVGAIKDFGFNPLGQNSGSSLSRECTNEDGVLETVTLPAGQIVCDNMVFYQPKIEDKIKDTPGWNEISAVSSLYQKALEKVVDGIKFIAPDSVERFASKVGDYASEGVGFVTDKSGLDNLLGEGADLATDYLFNPGCLGTENGQMAFDCYYAGMEAMNNAVGESGGEYGIGGQALTDIQVAAIYDEVQADRKLDFQQKSFFARLFDTNDYDSLLGKVALASPSDSTQLASSIGGAISNPFSTVASAFTSPVQAQAQPANFNPFGIIRYGYPVDSPAFTADWDGPALADCLTNTSDQRGEKEEINGVVFKVHTTTDACALERVATNVLGCLFTNVDDCGIDTTNPNDRRGSIGQFETPDLIDYKISDCTVEVSPGGSIQGAIQNAQPGDVVCIHEGDYPGNISVRDKIGTSNAKIAITGYPGEDLPVITAVNDSDCAFNVIANVQHVEFSRMHLIGTNTGSDKTQQAIGTCSSGFALGFKSADVHNIEIINNKIENFIGGGISAGRSNHITIAGNEIHNNSYWLQNQTSGISLFRMEDIGGSPDSDGYSNRITQNIIYSNENKAREHYQNQPARDRITDGNCVIFDQNNERFTNYQGKSLVQDNACFANGGRGIHVFESNFVDVINNTLLKNNQTEVLKDNPPGLGLGLPGELSAFEAHDVLFKDNLVWPEAGIKAISIVSSHDISTSGNMYVGDPNSSGADVLGSGDRWVSDNPGLVSDSIDPETANLSLIPGSEADISGVGSRAWIGTIGGSDLIVGDTSDIPCAPGTFTSERIDTEAYRNKLRYTIRLCTVHDTEVNSQISQAYYDLVNAAKAAGHNIGPSFGMRTMKKQQELYDCWKAGDPDCALAAVPGTSNHQYGVAIDIRVDDQAICFPRSTVDCKTSTGAKTVHVNAHQWLLKNAAAYGFEGIDDEAWHWSYGGG